MLCNYSLVTKAFHETSNETKNMYSKNDNKVSRISSERKRNI
jgi:hypothetical protein